MKKYKIMLFGLLFGLMILLVGWKTHESDTLQSQSRYLLDTYCTIKAPGDTRVLSALSKALDRIEEIDSKFNMLNPKSPLYDFNTNNKPITDKEIVDLVRIALDVSEKSDGKYDITICSVVNLWGFFSDKPAVPLQSSIDSLLNDVGYKSLKIENGILTKSNPRSQIDLGSIAKGYAVGEAVKVLRQEGITSALIDAGGDIYALGTYKGRPWKIGIKDPRGDGVIGSLDLTDMTVVTSGDYERYFIKDGKRYHHILDPQTGYPSQDMASVTIISPDPVLADGWSTALFVLGAEKGIPIIDAMQSTGTFMVTTDGRKIYSSGMQVNTQLVKRR
ncbi:MAG: FAD:protein FMN transferase [Candidatus Latescibacter sp.]|nr:FAD:protein FMN transferase [Candidatus Latescibacter sp.]